MVVDWYFSASGFVDNGDLGSIAKGRLAVHGEQRDVIYNYIVLDVVIGNVVLDVADVNIVPNFAVVDSGIVQARVSFDSTEQQNLFFQPANRDGPGKVCALDTSGIKSIRHADQSPVLRPAALGLESVNFILRKFPKRIFSSHKIYPLQDKFINQ
jgi:hypothetical protein